MQSAALPPAFVGQLVSTGIIAVGAYLLSKQETTIEQVGGRLPGHGVGSATQACAVSTLWSMHARKKAQPCASTPIASSNDRTMPNMWSLIKVASQSMQSWLRGG